MNTDIERYIAKEMNALETQEFENLLASDKDLAEEYKLSLAAYQLVKQAGRLDLKNTLESFDKEMEMASKPSKIFPLWLKRALPFAAILVLFFGIYQFVVFNNNLLVDDVFSTYFEAYSSPNSFRNSEVNNKINWEKASNYYREKEFNKAMIYFEKSENEVPKYLLSFYKGVTLLSIKSPEFQKSLSYFEDVLKNDNDYHQQANWYKALIHFELGEKEKAFKLLNTIVNNKEYNYKKAIKILKIDVKN